MKIRDILLSLNFIVLAVLGIYVFSIKQENRKAFILNQKVFKEFKGTFLLETNLEKLRKVHKLQLDSLSSQMGAERSQELILKYEELRRQYAFEEQELSEKYSADIWKEINQYVTDFGKEQDCDFIFGANGNGNLMFANDMHDVTDEVIQYINKRYEDE